MVAVVVAVGVGIGVAVGIAVAVAVGIAGVVGSLIMPTNANETIRERYQREHNEYVSSLERQVESLKGSCDSWSNRMVKKVTEANKIIEAQAAEIADQLSWMDRLLKTIRYMEGIAAKGEGRELRDDELVEQFVLNYVKRIEAEIAELRAENERLNATPKCGRCGKREIPEVHTCTPTAWARVKEAEIAELKKDAEMYALKDQDNYRLRSHLAVAVEALERVVLYQAHNGDDWPARQAKEALATIKGDSNEQD